MKFNFNRKNIIISIAILSVGLFLFSFKPAFANWPTAIIGGLAQGIVAVLGWVLSMLMGVLVYVAQYNDFINAGPVSQGWTVVRDIANMFFIVILLVIAFATILRIENYSYKKWLPKLILMAILINFSKTICGLMIDMAQVIMLTFVNAFKDVAAGSLVEMLGINNWQNLQKTTGNAPASNWEVASAYILAVIYVFMTLVTVAAMVGMLVMRIIMIWVYVVLSPFAYLLAAFPGGSKYSSQWWGDFTKNLIVGPVLAFFIWLSFASAVDFSSAESKDIIGYASQNENIECEGDACQFGTSELMMKFIISIAMLIGGMKIAQEIGGAAAGVASSISSKGNKLGIGLAAGVGGAALLASRRGVKNAGMAAINTKGVRNALDTVGSQKGVGGQVLRFTGVRSLARGASLSLGKHKAEVEEKAKKKVEAFRKAGAVRTIDSIASGRADTIGQKAAQKEAQKIAIVPQKNFNKRVGQIGLNAADRLEAQKRVNKLDLKKDTPSVNQVMQLGKSGIDLTQTPKFKRVLEKNAELRGAYNSGQREAGLTDYVIGTGKNNAPLTGRGRYGEMLLNASDRDDATGRTGGSVYAFREGDDDDDDDDDEDNQSVKVSNNAVSIPDSPEIIKQRERISQVTGSSDFDRIERTRKKIDTWNVQDGKDHFEDDNQIKTAYVAGGEDKKREEEKNKKEQEKNKQTDEEQKEKQKVRESTPGSGSLSVNGFASGKQEYMGVDFSKLDQKLQESIKSGLKPGSGLQNLKGLQVSDQGEIKKIAASMVGIIDSEIKSIKSKGTDISKSDENRLKNLEQAKNKLKEPEKLKNIELINSSALGYNSAHDVKKTIIHEDVHGRAGVYREDETHYLTKKAMASPADRNDIRTGEGNFIDHLEGQMDVARGRGKTPRNKSVKDVVAAENDSKYSFSDNLETGDNINNVTNINNIVNKQDKEKFKNDFKNNLTKTPDNSFMIYYFRNLISSLNKLSSKMGKNVQSAKPASPSNSADYSSPVNDQGNQGGGVANNSDINLKT